MSQKTHNLKEIQDPEKENFLLTATDFEVIGEKKLKKFGFSSRSVFNQWPLIPKIRIKEGEKKIPPEKLEDYAIEQARLVQFIEDGLCQPGKNYTVVTQAENYHFCVLSFTYNSSKSKQKKVQITKITSEFSLKKDVTVTLW